MYICYVDEAGCPGALPHATSSVQPCLVLAGLLLPQDSLVNVTNEFLSLKARFNPSTVAGKKKHFLDTAKDEIKGSDLRRDIRKPSRNRRRAVFGFIDKVLEILERYDAKIIARIYVKSPGAPFNGRAVYAASIQNFCACFQKYLEEKNSSGLIVADSRTPAQNSVISHSIFTQKFQIGGDPYGRLMEMPMFGHSENHVPLQITDILCSSILSPMATNACCTGHITSIHVHPMDALIQARYADRVRRLAYRYHDHDVRRWRGGVTLIDAIAHRPQSVLFATRDDEARPPALTHPPLSVRVNAARSEGADLIVPAP
jgi:Protein of unknown function (DUF3800)